MIPTDKLRKLIEAYEFKSKEAHDVYKTSIGYLVPSSMFSDYKNEDIDLKDRFDEFYKSPESKYLG